MTPGSAGEGGVESTRDGPAGRLADVPEGREDADGGVDHLDVAPPPVRTRRLVLAVVVAVLIALVAGVVLTDPGEASAPAPEPSVTPTRTPRPTPRPSPSVDADAPVRDRLADPPLPGADPDWELFVQGPTDVYRIELATGEYVRTPSRVAASDSVQASFVAGSEGLLAYSTVSGTAEYIPDDGPARRVQVAGADEPDRWVELVPGPTNRVWQSRIDSRMGDTTVQLLDLEGGVRGAPRRLDSPSGGNWWVSSDGAGGLLATGIGGTWELTAASARRLTRGQVHGVGPRALVLVDCDDTMVCRREVLDRASGERRPLPGERGDEGSMARFRGAWGAGRTAPDGSMMAAWVEGPDDNVLVVTDLVTGQVVRTVTSARDVGSVDYPNATVWAPDSRTLLVSTGDAVLILDPRSGEERRIELGAIGLLRLALRS